MQWIVITLKSAIEPVYRKLCVSNMNAANPVWYFYVCVSRVNKWGVATTLCYRFGTPAIQTLPGFQYISHRAQHYICIITHGHRWSIKNLTTQRYLLDNCCDAINGFCTPRILVTKQMQQMPLSVRSLSQMSKASVTVNTHAKPTDIHCQNSHITVKRLVMLSL